MYIYNIFLYNAVLENIKPLKMFLSLQAGFSGEKWYGL